MSAYGTRHLSPIEWAILPLKKFASFSGRAPRAEYWWFYLGTMIAQIPLKIVDSASGDLDPFSTLFSILILLPWMAVTVRRFHDTDRSGWWPLGFAILTVMIIVFLAVLGASGAENSRAMSFTTGIGVVLVILAAAITFLVFLVLPGTEGPNRYGPDPYGPDELEEVFA